MVAQPPIPPHRVRLPDPTGLFKDMPREDRAFLVELVAALQRELDRRIPFSSAQAEVMLFSPDGSTWALTISDAGAPVVTRRSGP